MIARLRTLYAQDLPTYNKWLASMDGIYVAYWLLGYILEPVVKAYLVTEDAYWLDEIVRIASGGIAAAQDIPGYGKGWPSPTRAKSNIVLRSWPLDEARAAAGLMRAALLLRHVDGHADLATQIYEFVHNDIIKKLMARNEWGSPVIHDAAAPLVASSRNNDWAFDADVQAIIDLLGERIGSALVPNPGVDGGLTYPNQEGKRYPVSKCDYSHYQPTADAVAVGYEYGVFTLAQVRGVGKTLMGSMADARGNAWLSTAGPDDCNNTVAADALAYAAGIYARWEPSLVDWCVARVDNRLWSYPFMIWAHLLAGMRAA
jgi:hypothetical protein